LYQFQIVITGQSAPAYHSVDLHHYGMVWRNHVQPFRRHKPNLIVPERLATATVGEHALASQKQRSGLHLGIPALAIFDRCRSPATMLQGICVANRCATTGFLFDWLGHDGSERVVAYDV
jgi:hypothetical protein